MWTQAHRARQAAFEHRRYPTDLTDPEWEQIRPLLPTPAKRGRKPGVDLPQVMLDMQKASVSLRATVEVRNKLVGAYQEIMNMPV